jgi:ABC-2 type transport system ATP-binding protein
MTSALAVEGVSKRFGGFSAVDDLSFEARRGGLLGFLGPNGAGKTTTLRMILGLVAPDAGRILALGDEDVRRVRDRIGFLPEERGLYRRMTPVDAIVFFAGLKGVPPARARRRALEMLEANGLAHAARRQVRRLSKGMAQRVQLLSALAHEPELVILDEPFSGLDPLAQQTLEELLRGLAAQGAAVVFSTHVMQHAERLCDRVVLIAGGRKVFDGSVADARAAAPRTLVLEGAIPAEASKDLPGLEDAAWESAGSGGRLTARLAAGAQVQAPLQAAFSRGWEISRFELREPSLHDAFIRLAGGGPS